MAPDAARDVAPGVATQVVDRFLSKRSEGLAGSAGEGETGRQGDGEKNPAPHSQFQANKVQSPAVAVDFVCENDVRAAMDAKRKIYVTPKAIVTPSARDLADRFDILVVTR
jgi:hypothetical protein